MKNNIELPNPVLEIINKLEDNNFQAFVVGGCCRDAILERSIHDYDITTSATPDQILSVFSEHKIILTGLKHGTVTIMIDNESFEVTTFRKDGNYSDSRRPDDVEFVTDIIEDLSRRDFTINAIAYNPKIGFVDPFDGIKDIGNKVIQCVGNSENRFKEDALRMMRAIRFSAQLGFSIDSDIQLGIKILGKNILNISKERIRDELSKILISENSRYVNYLCSIDILKYIIPELYSAYNCEQNNPYHVYNVGLHCVDSTAHIKNNLHLRLTMLLHDIGKPLVKTTDENGIDHFYKHELKSLELASKVLRDLKYDGDTITKVETLILHHMDNIFGNKRVIKRLLNTLGEETLRNLFLVRLADHKAQNLEYYPETEKNVLEAETILNQIIADKECFSMKDLAINGDDLLSIGFKQGKELGDVLRNLMNLVLENPEKNDKEELLNIAKSFITV